MSVGAAEEGGCGCDECARKEAMLQGLALVAQFGPAPPLLAELREDLARHRRRAALSTTGQGSRERLSARSERRPWLSYDPDALLPTPFDVFLLSGACPRIPWQPCSTVADKSQGVSACYIVGCGRSGTTVFAELLSCHSAVAFINEPRHLWIPFLPSLDVWSVRAPERQGKLALAPQDAQAVPPGEGQTVAELVGDAYRDIAGLAAGASERCVVLEKFPEHAFRIPFLAAVCDLGLGPGRCSVIHLVRDGLEVARSVARFGSSAAWYGVRGDWKWRQLAALLPDADLALPDAFWSLLESPDEAKRLFARGLAEWALSVQAARRGAAAAGASVDWLEVRYEDLLARPVEVLADVEQLLGLSACEDARQRAVETLRAGSRPTQPPTRAEAEVLRALRGSRLEELMRACGCELVPLDEGAEDSASAK